MQIVRTLGIGVLGQPDLAVVWRQISATILKGVPADAACHRTPDLNTFHRRQMERKQMAKAKIPCPICRKPARLKTPAYGDYQHFDCPECGEFQASGSFSAVARGLSIATRRLALQGAITRAEYGTVPTVTTYDLP
jgi:hypothetical protein